MDMTPQTAWLIAISAVVIVGVVGRDGDAIAPGFFPQDGLDCRVDVQLWET